MRRYTQAFNADVRGGYDSAALPERGPDFSRAGHLSGQPLQLEKGLVDTRIGDAGIRKGIRGLRLHRQVHGVTPDCWP